MDFNEVQPSIETVHSEYAIQRRHLTCNWVPEPIPYICKDDADMSLMLNILNAYTLNAT